MVGPTDPNSGGLDYGPVGDGAGQNYNPNAVQRAIWQIIHRPLKPGEHVSQADLMLLFFLMNTYGQQNVGLDANLQTHVNDFLGYLSQINNAIHEADVDSASGGTKGTTDFVNALSAFKKAFDSDSFYNLPGQSGVKQQIDSTISELLEVGNSSPSALENLWNLFNGVDGSGNALPPSGVHTQGINSLTSNTGMLGSQLGGLSKGIMAQTQSDTSMTTTEQDTLNNFVKKLYSLYLFMLGQMKTQ